MKLPFPVDSEKEKNILNPFYARLKKFFYSKRIGIFLFFLVISSILWILNELDNEYATRISYPIHFTDFPEEKVHVGDVPSSISLKVKGKGFKLLEYKIRGNLDPIELNIDSYNLFGQEENNKSIKFYILTSRTQDRVSQQLGSEVEIIDINPDTLFFEFAERMKKEVPVFSRIEYTLDKQLMLKEDIQVEPDSVIVSGPGSVVDTVNKIYTAYHEFPELSSDIEKTIALKAPHRQLDIEPREVTIKMEVEQFNEGELTIGIDVVNEPDSVMLRLFPNTVRINYLVGLSNYESVIKQLFEAQVDYRETKENKGEKLEVEITKYPDYLKSFSYHPQKVDYIIEKK